jgi:type VI secretion system secreted protein VgrG
VSRIVMEEREALTHQVRGKANCTGVVSGYRLDVTGHYRRDVNQGYQILSVRHDALVTEYETVDSRALQRANEADRTAPFVYTASFVGIPQGVPYRPPRVTPRSIVHGSQTAVVVGPSGEEIYVDKYGRIKVQFFWDQLGKSNENSSCWIRVSSTWAGKNWGVIQLPRIGQEVVVDFLEGDPDRPIVTGRVYNAEMMPPYALPANMTQSGVKSRSSKGGTASTFNELRFEDKKDSEEVYLHSQKDLNVVTENNETWKVIAGSRTTEIKKDDTTTVKDGNRKVTINTGNETLIVSKGNMSTEVAQGNQELKVKTGNMTTEHGERHHQGERGQSLHRGDARHRAQSGREHHQHRSVRRHREGHQGRRSSAGDGGSEGANGHRER